MKKVFYLLFVVALIATTSCKDEVAQLYTVNVTVNNPDGYDGDAVVGMLVKATGVTNSVADSATTDGMGVATFTLEAGQYNFATSGEDADFAFNGVKENVEVAADVDVALALQAVSLEGGLVIKEIYYTGSRTPEDGSYYADQFHEIYNNSDEVIYLDGLCIGLHAQSSSTESVWVDDNGALLDKLPMTFHTWYIPGNGTDYPLQPRTSMIIAQDGINHMSDPDGNANSPVDLSIADWETYCGDVNDGKDADAAGVPNLSMMYTTTTTMYDWLHSVFGAAVFIFRLPEGVDPLVYAADATNFMTKPGSTSTREYLTIPSSYVIDAVEVVRIEEEKRYKRLSTELDAGKVWCSGTYISKSIRRKVKQIIDGKVIYKDTNNSSEDFLISSESSDYYDQDPTPGVFSSSVEE